MYLRDFIAYVSRVCEWTGVLSAAAALARDLFALQGKSILVECHTAYPPQSGGRCPEMQSRSMTPKAQRACLFSEHCCP